MLDHPVANPRQLLQFFRLFHQLFDRFGKGIDQFRRLLVTSIAAYDGAVRVVTSDALKIKKRPAGGESCRPRLLLRLASPCFLYVCCLWSLGPLNDLEFDRVAFLQRPITVSNDGGVVDKNIRTIFPSDEAVSLRVVKPFYGSLHLDLPPEDRFICSPRGRPYARVEYNCAECNRTVSRVNRP